MNERIRQLEDALQISHTTSASTSHPLLSKELLAIKNCLDIPGNTELYETHSEDDSLSELYSDLGTLTISDHGESRFYGRSGAAVSSLH